MKKKYSYVHPLLFIPLLFIYIMAVFFYWVVSFVFAFRWAYCGALNLALNNNEDQYDNCRKGNKAIMALYGFETKPRKNEQSRTKRKK